MSLFGPAVGFSGTLVVAGIGLVLFSHRYMSQHKANLSNGKTYVWTEEFRGELGRLVCELDDEIDLQDKLEQRKQFLQSIPEIAREDNQFSDKIAEDIPYSAPIRNASEGIREHAGQINSLESHYKTIPKYRQRIGVGLVSIGLLIGGVALLNETKIIGDQLSQGILVAVVPITAFVAREIKIHKDKTDELHDFSQKYEEGKDL